MNQPSILWPLLALIGWTLCVLLLIPYRRFKAAFAGRVTPQDFKFGESANVPPEVGLPNRHFQNLLEVPVLFYVVGILGYVTQHVDPLTVGLAWGYVACRLLHSLVHLTYNHVFHRFLVFAASNLLLAVLWARLALALP